jgi:CelD/BcsL family acetyltransferase involved in cellulose biosynthesis
LNLFVETLSSESDVRSIEDRWGELACNDPFLHPMWCLAWWECFQTPEMQLRVMVARNATGEIVGIAPFYLRTSSLMGRELRFLGDGHICSEYLSLLSEPNAEIEVVNAIADALHLQGQNEKRGTWDMIDLDCYRSEDRNVSALKNYMQEHGHACHIDEVMGCWRIDFSEGWEAYLSKMSKSRRSKGRRLLKQIQGEGPYEAKWIEHHADIESFMNHLTNLHQSRWEKKGESGCFADPKFGKFLRQVAVKAQRCGRAHLLQLNYQGMPVALQFGLRSDSTIYSYQVGVDTSTTAESPGMAMNMLLINDGTQRGLTSLDFLRGDEPYKQSLRAERIRTERLHVFARYPLAHLRYRCWRTACEAKRLAKDWLKTPQKSNPTIEQEA